MTSCSAGSPNSEQPSSSEERKTPNCESRVRTENLNKKVLLQNWLQKFILDNGIKFSNEDGLGTSSSGAESSNEKGKEISNSSSEPEEPRRGTFPSVPDRLKTKKKKEEDCFTPRAFPIGLHNVVSCFNAKKLGFKVDIAKSFLKYVFPDNSQNSNSERWKALVGAIVGDSEEQRQATEAYDGFCAWELTLQAEPSTSTDPLITIKHWHFALLLTLDSIFLVTTLQASMLQCRAVTDFKQSDYYSEVQLSEFLKWDLSLVENQIPLKLLRKVINLQISRTNLSSILISEAWYLNTKLRNVNDHDQLERLIMHAVWLSYPFLHGRRPDRDECCRNFIGCCCPCCNCGHSDIEDGGGSTSRAGSVESRRDFEFEVNWKDHYSERFSRGAYDDDHILHCTHIVSSWISATREVRDADRRLADRRCRSEAVPLVSCTPTCARNEWNGDRIPSATQLRDAGVRIIGVATCLANTSFKTMNFWTVLTSVCCFLPLWFQCLCNCCSSITRRQASLELPQLKLYIETKRLLRNLVVYEQLVLGSQNGHLRNYIKSMRCLVHKEEDVLLLISSGVIQSHLAGSKDVIENLMHIDDGLDTVPLSGPWINVYKNLREHRNNRWKNWYARFWISNCSNPMVACTFLIFLMLTLISAFGTYLTLARSLSDRSFRWNLKPHH